MLRVEILLDEGKSWVDHAGNIIDKLIFSNEYNSGYVRGHYPVSSFGSLYRNIDDIRESLLQSRTDWELRVPSLYTSADGEFQTVDLLYALEDANEKVGNEFNLIGCKAVLYDIDDIHNVNNMIYKGVVESFTCSAGTASLRISDWLGNPKLARSEFLIVIGEAGDVKWPVEVTYEKGIVRLKLWDMSFEYEPDLFLKTKDGFAKIERFTQRLYLQPLSVEYSDGWKSGVIRDRVGGKVIGHWPSDTGRRLNVYLTSSFSEAFKEDLLILGQVGRTEPIYYMVGRGDDFEVLEAWAITPLIGQRYPLGRSKYPDERREHEKDTEIRRLDELNVFAAVTVRLFVESLIGGGEISSAYLGGNPSQLVHNSREGVFDYEPCPYFMRAILAGFTVMLSDARLPGDAITAQGKDVGSLRLNIALKGNPAYFCIVTVVSQGNYADYPTSWQQFYVKLDGSLHSFELDWQQHKTLSVVRKFQFFISVGELAASSPVHVSYISIDCTFLVPIKDQKIYVSGKAEKSYGNDSADMTVKGTVRSLLDAVGVNSEVSGSSNSLLYGHVINREAVTFRDMLRSLAAESATLIKFSSKKEEIIVKKSLLQEEQEIIFIPLSAFVLENNIYSFSVESPDRSELLSGVEIHWSKDIETGKYEHVFSVTPALGIVKDGKQAGYDYIPEEKWETVKAAMARNLNRGVGIDKLVESKWITNWDAAENMAYNLLRWNTKPMRKAQATCIFTELNKCGDVDIGTFVYFNLPGYPQKFSLTAWAVTGRHDDLNAMVSTLELLEIRDLPVASPGGYLLLENRQNMFFEDSKKIKLEEFNG
ncbi:MAG: hypothetical protein LBC64_01925 [Fibromonadaceae bacterium]|jgi:hypothetical protein|nr:hypothetical protein [Fibromonadaceae bacterium]